MKTKEAEDNILELLEVKGGTIPLRALKFLVARKDPSIEVVFDIALVNLQDIKKVCVYENDIWFVEIM